MAVEPTDACDPWWRMRAAQHSLSFSTSLLSKRHVRKLVFRQFDAMRYLCGHDCANSNVELCMQATCLRWDPRSLPKGRTRYPSSLAFLRLASATDQFCLGFLLPPMRQTTCCTKVFCGLLAQTCCRTCVHGFSRQCRVPDAAILSFEA